MGELMAPNVTKAHSPIIIKDAEHVYLNTLHSHYFDCSRWKQIR